MQKIDIPTDIINIILFYYYIYFEFYKQQHGKGLVFINDKIVKMNVYNSMGSTCLFGELISTKICKKYQIHFQLLKEGISSHYFSFGLMFGYAESKNSIKDWNNCIGNKTNREQSTGFYVGSSFTDFAVYDKNNVSKVLQYKSTSKFMINDVFGLEYDFINDEIQIYHNYNKADKLSLNGIKSLITAISLFDKKTSIKILKQTFY